MRERSMRHAGDVTPLEGEDIGLINSTSVCILIYKGLTQELRSDSAVCACYACLLFHVSCVRDVVLAVWRISPLLLTPKYCLGSLTFLTFLRKQMA